MDWTALQKQRERAFIEKFRDLCKDFPNGKISSFEAPDFIIEDDDTCVGIEVTELHDQSYIGAPESLRAQEGRRESTKEG